MSKVRRVLIGLAIIPALAAGMMVSVARAQTEEQIESVSVRPQGTTPNDPNGGQWFITNLNPEESKQLQVQLTNSANVAQEVKLYLADINFDAKGSPEVANVATDVGTWGRFDHPTITLAPHQTSVESFWVTAPRGVDPGDHVGAVVVEHTPQGTGNIRSVKRVAVRLYATLPGDARRDFVIDSVTVKRDSAFFARELTITVQLRNTGRVRLESAVQVDGKPAKGSQLLMSNAIERYVVKRPVKFWGGPMRLNIDAQTSSLGLPGPARQLRVTTWVIPWHLLLLLAFAAGLFFLVRRALRKRGGKYKDLQSDMRRIERLISAQNRQTQPDDDPSAGRGDPDAAVRGAIKQARRAGDLETADRLEQALAEREAQHLASSADA
jgi:hypothetical protein